MSISTESTTADITADSEWWPPNFANLDPFEEKQLLLARIAELDRQQTTNSPTSSASVDLIAQNRKRKRIEDPNESFGKQLEQMEEWKRVAKLELENGMNQLKGELSAKMEQYQKQQQQNIGDLRKTVATLRDAQNRWDFTTSQEGLKISGLIVKITGQHYDLDLEPFSVFAALPIPKRDSGIFYYEVTILKKAFNVCIGLAPPKMPSDEIVGEYKGTYAYWGDGTFRGHAVAGCSYQPMRGGRVCPFRGGPYIGGKPKFGPGSDVIGCGINLASRQIIYTRNGQLLETTGLFVNSTAKLFPCVTLLHPGDKIEANFGPEFVYNFSDGEEEARG